MKDEVQIQLNWDKAKSHIEKCRVVYNQMHCNGLFAILYVINPLLLRYEKGERSEELYKEIMEVKL